VAEVLANDGGVPLEGWQQLAQSFLDHLDAAGQASR
jgi:hypothetical protein